MHAVQMRLRRVADEELTAARVPTGVRHRQRPRDVLVHVLVGLTLDRVAGSARADAPLARLGTGVAPLDHEIRDDAVELGAIVESRVGELLEVGDGIGNLVGEQLQLDATLGSLEHGLLVRHHGSRERRSASAAGVATGSEQEVPTHTVAVGAVAILRTTILRGRYVCSASRCMSHAAPGPCGPDTSMRVTGLTAQSAARSKVAPYRASCDAAPPNVRSWRSSRRRQSWSSVSAERRARTNAATPLPEGVGASWTGLAGVARYAAPPPPPFWSRARSKKPPLA